MMLNAAAWEKNACWQFLFERLQELSVSGGSQIPHLKLPASEGCSNRSNTSGIVR